MDFTRDHLLLSDLGGWLPDKAVFARRDLLQKSLFRIQISIFDSDRGLYLRLCNDSVDDDDLESAS